MMEGVQKEIEIRKKKLPIGIENFEEIRKEDFYYIDKTRLIAELLHNWGAVNLFTRPRRFGIKACETGENRELDYQIKVAKNKLSALGIPPEDYEM